MSEKNLYCPNCKSPVTSRSVDYCDHCGHEFVSSDFGPEVTKEIIPEPRPQLKLYAVAIHIVYDNPVVKDCLVADWCFAEDDKEAHQFAWEIEKQKVWENFHAGNVANIVSQRVEFTELPVPMFENVAHEIKRFAKFMNIN